MALLQVNLSDVLKSNSQLSTLISDIKSDDTTKVSKAKETLKEIKNNKVSIEEVVKYLRESNGTN